MTAVLLVAAVVALGAALVRRLVGAAGGLVETLAWAPALGLGALSLGYFALRYAGGAGLLVAAGALVLLVSLRREEGSGAPLAPPPTLRDRLLFALGLAVLIVVFVILTQHYPRGSWDATAIWNVRARFLARADGDLAALFHATPRGHPDYPLFVPASVAALFRLGDTESELVPAAVGLAIALGLACAVPAAVRRLGDPRLAVPAALLVLGAPVLLTYAPAQMADVAVAYLLVLAATGLASRLDPDRERRLPALPAGLALGLLAWTKNEGIVLAGILGVALVLVSARSAPARRALRADAPRLALGIALPAAALVCFKLSWAPGNDLARGLGPTLGASLADPGRWLGSARGWASELVTTARWGVVWLFFLAVLALAARRRTAWVPPRVRLLSLWLGLTAVAWYMVYVLTPRDQGWHIAFSLERLLLQLFPTALVWLACVVSEHGRGAGEARAR